MNYSIPPSRIRLETQREYVLLLILNRAEAMKATTGASTSGVNEGLARGEYDLTVSIIVATVAGDRAFSAEGELSWIGEIATAH